MSVSSLVLPPRTTMIPTHTHKKTTQHQQHTHTHTHTHTGTVLVAHERLPDDRRERDLEGALGAERNAQHHAGELEELERQRVVERRPRDVAGAVLAHPAASVGAERHQAAVGLSSGHTKKRARMRTRINEWRQSHRKIAPSHDTSTNSRGWERQHTNSTLTCSSVAIWVTASRYGPPASIEPSPWKLTCEARRDMKGLGVVG